MTFFSLHARDHRRNRKGSSDTTPLPVIYAIGSKSAEHQEVEWALEVEFQQPREKSRSSITVSDKKELHRPQEKRETVFRPRTKKSEDADVNETTPSQRLSSETALLKIESTFFSLRDGNLGHRSSTLPIHNPVVKISVPISPDYPSGSATTLLTSVLLDEVEQCLHVSTSTTSSEERLKCALLNLQRQQLSDHHILPSTQQGFDVDKFVYFATSVLQYRYSRFQSLPESAEDKGGSPSKIPEQYVSQEQIEACRGDERTVQKIDYAKFLRENAELRRQIEQGTRGKFLNLDNYPELRARESESDGGHDRKPKKRVGGFWVSYGPSSGGTASNNGDDEEVVREQPNPYGGLM